MSKDADMQAMREMMREQVLGAQQDGMKLGIKYGARTLREVAEEASKDKSLSSDYIRGLRDAAVLIERFMDEAAASGVIAAWDSLGISPASRVGPNPYRSEP